MSNINIIQQPFEGLFVFQTTNFNDRRGAFQKVFSTDTYNELGLKPEIKEIYFSKNTKGVIRGMHFQSPPYEHDKIVYVSNGSILDVILDLRKHSPTYGMFFSIELNSDNGIFLYISKGFAHGFLSLEDETIVNYAQTTCYNPLHDLGVRYDSFGFNWNKDNPVVSDRDLNFIKFEDFNSPF